MKSAAPSPAGRKRPTTSQRINDPARTTADIIAVATREFAENGLAGARIDEIAQAMRTSKRMIYYYFGSKERLYISVLEHAYRHIREAEAALELDELEPEEALRKLVGFTVDYQLAHPDFVRLIMSENTNRARYLAQSETIGRVNVPAIALLEALYRRGVAKGVFRPAVDLIDLHMSISALAVFNVANRHTFSLIFRTDFESAPFLRARRDSIIKMVTGFVTR